MKLLGIDTSGTSLSVGLLRGEAFYELYLDYGLHHTEHLANETAELLEKADISARELDLVACTSGPGSFTGLRIGMSFAKGYSFGASAPLVSIPSLDILAYGREYFDGEVYPVIDARKKRIYTAAYLHGERRGDYLDITPESFLSLPAENSMLFLTGPYAEYLLSYYHEQGVESRTIERMILDPLAAAPRARALIDMAKKEYRERGATAHSEGPLYIRPSEAELSASKNTPGAVTGGKK